MDFGSIFSYVGKNTVPFGKFVIPPEEFTVPPEEFTVPPDKIDWEAEIEFDEEPMEEQNLTTQFLTGTAPQGAIQRILSLAEQIENAKKVMPIINRANEKPIEISPLLKDDRVIKHGRSLFWGAMDLSLALLGDKYKVDGFLRRAIYVETPESENSKDIAECMCGFQAEFYVELAIDFCVALSDGKEGLAAVIANRLYLLGTYGKLKIHCEAEIDDIRRKFPFVNLDRLMSPMGLLWVTIYNVIVIKRNETECSLKPEDILTIWKLHENEEAILKKYAFRIIAIICRTGKTKKTLDMEPLISLGQVKAALKKELGLGEKEKNIPKFERRFYIKFMTNLHAVNGHVTKEDLADMIGDSWVEDDVENLKREDLSFSEETNKRKAETEIARPKKSSKKSYDPVPVIINKDTLRVNVRREGAQDYLSKEMNIVLRGPYHNIKRVQTIHKILDVLDLETLYPGVKIYKPQAYYKDEKIYIQYGILASKNPEEWITQDGPENKYTFCTPESMGVKTFAEHVKEHPEDLEKHFVSIYMTFFWFYVLHIGDRTLENIMYVNGELFFVKMDSEKKDPFVDRCPEKGKRSDVLDFVFSKPLKKDQKQICRNAFLANREKIERQIDIMENMLGFSNTCENSRGVFEKAETPLYACADALKIDREYFWQPYSQANQTWFQ